MPQTGAGDIRIDGEALNRLVKAGNASITTYKGQVKNSTYWNDRSFSPSTPLTPASSQTEQEDGPRETEYPVAANTQPNPRSEYPIPSMAMLRNLCRLYAPAALATRQYVSEMRTLKPQIVAKDDRFTVESQPDIDRMTAFWQKPDGVHSFRQWFGAICRDRIEIDAATIYPVHDRIGRLKYLRYINGASIKVLVRSDGMTTGYQQVLYGLPQSSYQKPDPHNVLGPMPSLYAPHQLIYMPYEVHTDNPYGYPPVEDVIVTVSNGLSESSWLTAHFSKSDIPSKVAIMSETMSAEGINQFQRKFNARYAGNLSARQQIVFLPGGVVKLIDLKDWRYDPVLAAEMRRLTWAAFGTNEQEMGYTQHANKASAGHQESLQYRRLIIPESQFWKEFFDDIIQLPEPYGFGYPHLEWSWDFGELDNFGQKVMAYVQMVSSGIISPRQAQTELLPDLAFDEQIYGEGQPDPSFAILSPPGKTPGQPTFGKSRWGKQIAKELAI